MRKQVEQGRIRLQHIRTGEILADIMIKMLLKPAYTYIVKKLGLDEGRG